MKDTILWLNLPQRIKPDKRSLYSSITDISKWIDRTSKKKTGEQARLYFSLLVEVNALDISVQERLNFLENFHPQVLKLVSKLSKKYSGHGLPLGEEKSRYVELVNAFWSEMAAGYKIILDDLSDTGFISAFFSQSELISAINMVLYYLTHQAYYSYLLYSECTMDVWRDMHQVYHFAEKRSIVSKITKNKIAPQISIEDQYKKILLFSLANPYHLSTKEMKQLWEKLNPLVKYSQIKLNSAKVIEKHFPFLIKPYSDLPPFANLTQNHLMDNKEQLLNELASDSIWGFETKKLIKYIDKHRSSINISSYLLTRISRVWSGDNFRANNRKALIEPVVVAMGGTCISQFLSKINIKPKILKLEDLDESEEQVKDFESSLTTHSIYQAFLMDESDKGFRIKLSLDDGQKLMPKIGEVTAIKHHDDSIHIGYLRWIRENDEGEIELGIEYLSSMAEPVQLILSNNMSPGTGDEENTQHKILDSFVFPGGKADHFKPILFTHAFIERFSTLREQPIQMVHKTGKLDIKLTHKVDEILDYTLYLFEKADPASKKGSLTQREKTARFDSMWKKI